MATLLEILNNLLPQGALDMGVYEAKQKALEEFMKKNPATDLEREQRFHRTPPHHKPGRFSNENPTPT